MFFSFMLPPLILASAAQALPKVHLLYPPPMGTVFDRNCSGMLNGAPVIDRAWVEEAIRRAPEFQARWDKEGPAYLSATFDEIKLAFPFSEMQAALTVCPVASMSVPLIINVRGYLGSGPRRLPDSDLPRLIFHELMHTYVRPVSAVSGLRKKHASENVVTLNHLHVMALEKFVLIKLGKTSELSFLDQRYRKSPDVAYKRAWEIVNDVESYEAFINELKAAGK